MVANVRTDPLHLFTPVLQRLRNSAANSNYDIVDDCIFTKDGHGLAFLTSSYGTSESGMNSKVAGLVDEAISRTEAEHPDVSVSAVGAPLIAVTNATQIKRTAFWPYPWPCSLSACCWFSPTNASRIYSG